MNPVDHPHGGKSGLGRAPVTPWGFFTKWKSTRKRSKFFLEKKFMVRVFRGKV
jgi:large subunit ribosomal protein L2